MINIFNKYMSGKSANKDCITQTILLYSPFLMK